MIRIRNDSDKQLHAKERSYYHLRASCHAGGLGIFSGFSTAVRPIRNCLALNVDKAYTIMLETQQVPGLAADMNATH